VASNFGLFVTLLKIEQLICISVLKHSGFWVNAFRDAMWGVLFKRFMFQFQGIKTKNLFVFKQAVG
jgi:hypothetical protein